MAEAMTSGPELLNDPLRNKGTAFTTDERRDSRLEGLLPAAVETLGRQVERVLGHLEAKPNDLERYIYLQNLCDINETLFYATVISDPARFVPIVYDPTIADACLQYGHIFRKPRGMYLTKHMKGRFAAILGNWPIRDVRFICISSGGRILGLGDIGVNGAPIPIGKLQLYTACAAVPPDCLLPIHLDIGTTNAAATGRSSLPGPARGAADARRGRCAGRRVRRGGELGVPRRLHPFRGLERLGCHPPARSLQGQVTLSTTTTSRARRASRSRD